MNATIKDNILTITIPINPTPVPSASGKTLVVASSHGNVPTTAQVQGKPVVIGLNAYTAHIDATPGAHDWRELWPGFVQQLRRTPPAGVAPAPAVKVDVVRPNPWRERLMQRANQTGFVQNLERVLV